MRNKRKRTCRQCKTVNLLTPSQLKKWSGFCNRSCKTAYNQNDIRWLTKTIQKEFNSLVASKGVCEKCDRGYTVMQCSHVWSIGSYSNLRFDILNTMCMCGTGDLFHKCCSGHYKFCLKCGSVFECR